MTLKKEKKTLLEEFSLTTVLRVDPLTKARKDLLEERMKDILWDSLEEAIWNCEETAVRKYVVNLFHVFVIAPLLIYVGLKKRETTYPIPTLMLILGIGGLFHYIKKLFFS